MLGCRIGQQSYPMIQTAHEVSLEETIIQPTVMHKKSLAARITVARRNYVIRFTFLATVLARHLLSLSICKSYSPTFCIPQTQNVLGL